MSQAFKVALIQLWAEPVNAPRNFERAESFIRSAASQGAVLAVLPEYHLSGWTPEKEGSLEICDQWEVYLQKYCDLARDAKICIVPGTIVQREKHSESGEYVLYNVAYFIDDTGKVLGKYTKKNLWYVTH
jgi:predicted amidohydrolase